MGGGGSGVQSPNHIQFFAAPLTTAHQASLSLTSSQTLFKLMSIVLVMPSSHPSSPSALNHSQHQGLFQWVNFSHQMTKVLEFQLQHQSFQRVFRVDFPYGWIVWSPCCPGVSQKSCPAPQFEGISSLVLRLLLVELSQLRMTTGKTIALTIPTFVDRVIPLLFSILSRYDIDFLPRSICLLISWLQSPSTVLLEPKERKSVPFCLPWSNRTRWHDLSFLTI